MDLSRRLFIALPALGASVATFAQSARAQAQTIKLATTAVNDLDTYWLEQFKKNLEAASGGKVLANVYPASQLGSGSTMAEGLAMGTIEAAINASGVYETLEPRFAILSMPGLFNSMAEGARLLAKPEVRKIMEPIGRDKGVQTLTLLAHSPVGIVTRKPIQTLADFKGMKIRVPGSPLLVEQLKQVGAAPIAMSLGEVLPAFQNGTIDGVYAGTTIFTALKYYDIAKNMTLLPSTFIIILGLVNSDFVQGLGPMQSIVADAAHKADVDGAAWGETDVDNAKGLWEKNGGKVYSLSDEEAKKYLDIVIPVGLKALTPAAQADYQALRAIALQNHG